MDTRKELESVTLLDNNTYYFSDAKGRSESVRPNILNNWYFVGGGSQQGNGVFPINQREATSYTGAVFGIDFWTGTSANTVVSLLQNYLQLSGLNNQNAGMQNFINSQERIYGKTVTASCLLDDDVLLSVTTTIPKASVSNVTGAESDISNGTRIGVYKNPNGQCFVQIDQTAGAVAKIIAVKLEIGDFQTLAHKNENEDWILNAVPDWQLEMYKCNPATGGGGQEIEVSDTEPINPSVDVWFKEQQQGTPVEVYTVPEINDMIAPAETSPTQAAHHVGEYIICVLNGQAKLYRVINEISVQETLTVGGNIEKISIMSDLTVPTQAALSLNTVVATANYGSLVEKIGNLKLCIIRIRMARNLATDTLYDLATIPSNYAATYMHELNVPARNSANSNATAIFLVSGQQLQVKVVGDVSEYNYIAAIIPYI